MLTLKIPLHLFGNASLDDLNLRFYKGSFENFVSIPLSEAVALFYIREFAPFNRTTFYAHANGETTMSDSVKALATAYLETKPDINFILLDWSTLNQGKYIINARNTEPVGIAFAAQLNTLTNSGLPLNNIHLVGHSLGGQLIGYTGRELRNTYRKTLKRITALDPAMESFYPNGALMEHIRPTDAETVDIIHTDAGEYGAPVPTGTVDFWPNGGTPVQPGCTMGLPLQMQSFCSHSRSWMYYAESVRKPDAFPAAPGSFLEYHIKPNLTPITNITKVGMVYMGFSCPGNISGNYYLTTNAEPPFGKGIGGLI